MGLADCLALLRNLATGVHRPYQSCHRRLVVRLAELGNQSCGIDIDIDIDINVNVNKNGVVHDAPY
jgi:hypothetical protein